ncbi:MAG: endo-1,4-beta-xylanase [Planctomycetota bacterium]|nr:endo-1,4-beta-xylanase [Planctomycetota bacterium]
MKTTRRRFLQYTAAAWAGDLACRSRAAGIARMGSPDVVTSHLTVRCYTAKGEPLLASALGALFLFEAAGDRNSLPHPKRELSDGAVRTEVPQQSVGFSHAMAVEGFGNVRMYADAEGRGYRSGQEVILNREFAASRLAVVDSVLAQARTDAISLPDAILTRVQKAKTLLRQGDASRPEPRKAVPLWMQSLRESLWAGEELVLARARHAIARRGPRKGFLFGCNFFGYPAQGEAYAQRFAELFNFATLPLYWRSFEPEEGKPRFARVDEMLGRLEKLGIAAKGHPLCWFHEAGCPTWMAGKSFEQWRQRYRQRITEIVTRYRGRIPVYDVINEAHDWGNDPHFSQEQLLEMTRIAADATHAADPKAVRVVNNCCLFGEYVASQTTYKGKQPRPLRSPLQYLRSVLQAGVQFDAIGLQVYYPEHDMLEISRMLDRFAALGKPLHVTELGVSSSDERDENAHGKEPSKAYWHAPWSETIQADWIEQFYTVCYAHPAVQAVTWWDFADAGGHFWPHGGFLRPDRQPKESFGRLQRLLRQWSQTR